MRIFLLLFLVVSSFAAQTDTETAVTQGKVNVTDHFIFSNAQSANPTAPRENSLLHEDRVRGEYGPLNAGVSFANTYAQDVPNFTNQPFLLEKVHAEMDTEHWRVTVGDSHQELGRGIALALYRDQVFGIDNTLRGSSVRYNPGFLQASVFAGKVMGLSAPVAINPMGTALAFKDYYLAGASATVDISPVKTKLGSHYLHGMSRFPDETDFSSKTHTVGATLNQSDLIPDTELYLESNLLLTEAQDPTPNGWGNYGALSYAANPIKLKLEGKDYRDFTFPFRKPPTLEEDIITTQEETNVSAVKFGVEHRSSPSSVGFSASYLLGEDRLVNSPIHHAVVGAKMKMQSRVEWETKAGYRVMPGSTDPETFSLKSDLVHVAFKTKLPTAKGQSIELGLRKQLGHSGMGDFVTPDDRNLIDLGYSFSENFSIGVGYEFIPTNADEQGQHFANLAATYKRGVFSGRALVGSTSGGTQCSGGVCRVVPPYKGAMLETTVSF